MQKTYKMLGQNFLVDKGVVKRFISFCNLSRKDIVLEIGVGKGVLTKEIGPTVTRTFGIEIDPTLSNEVLSFSISNLQIFNEDFLKIDLKKYIQEYKINKIIGAIPYYISSPIIHKIMREIISPLQEICLITQLEFAKKLIGKERQRSYFTNFIERYARIIPGEKIEKSSFNPTPKVDSYYFKIKTEHNPEDSSEVVKWSRFLHYVFMTPRKKINKRFENKILLESNIDPNLRPENLSLKELEYIYNLTSKK